MTESTKNIIDRRCFIKKGSLAGTSILGLGSLVSCLTPKERQVVISRKETGQMFRVGCPAHNCGGRCLLKVYVNKGEITRIETDDRPDSIESPQLRACIRGRAYRKRQYHQDRLEYPMKRIGKRGDARFERISWDEAEDIMVEQINRIRTKYGNDAILIPYGTGSYNQINGRWTAQRLMNLVGGSLNYYNSYSTACISRATPYIYGTGITGNQRQDWLNSKYIIMWSWNPAEMRDGTNSDYIIKEARKRGAKVVCIDPRMSMSAVALADEWIPVRPGTDAALMSAMAYSIITENLHDKEFIDRCCIGFDRDQMPEGLKDQESYSDYILGTVDGIPKTPEWASSITSVPASTITRIAREYAGTKPAMLYQGYGMQRRAYGEQPVLAGCALAAITGNVGIPGGWASGYGLQADDGGPMWNIFPTGTNPVKASIPVFLWTEAILRGNKMTKDQGLRGTEKLGSDLKMIWSVASNILINQHSNINRTRKILENESLVEFIAVQDQFMTPTARYADLILPVATQFETWGVEDGWMYGEEVLLMPKIAEAPGEAKSDYLICAGIAEKFGVKEKYTENKTEQDWIDWSLNRYRETRYPGIPRLKDFEKSNNGVHTEPVLKPKIAFEDFRKDPGKYPLKTPSGKIELFSQQLFEKNNPQEIPAVPKYIQEWESPFGPEAEKYPLQALGHHYMARVHSTHDNNEWTKEAFPQRVFINPLDAKTRGIKNGDLVKVYNHRGTIIHACRLTKKILPGVVNIPQGAWWNPDKEGNDIGGNVNTLTSERWTPIAYGNAQHTIMVEVEKFRKGADNV